MKLTTEDKDAVNGVTTDSNIINLPQGIFGFPDLRSCELIFNQDELPFMWLQEQQKGGLAFIVLEPIGFIPDYTVTEPAAPFFVDYLNNRNDWTSEDPETALSSVGDLGPEGLVFMTFEYLPNC